MPKKPSPEYNFASHHPHLLDEWDYNKNPKQPSEYTPSSGQSVWWICKVCQNNWKTTIGNRIKPTGCPSCKGKKVHSDGYNSLPALKPLLVLEWCDERSPEEFRIGSGYRARWKCQKCEHIWRSPINKRALLDRGCLSCTRQQVHSSGRDSVKLEHPELMDEWNDERDPGTFLSGSSVKVDWKCRECTHEWPMQIKKRTPGVQGNQGCTYCNGPGGKHSRVVHSDGRNSMRELDSRLTLEFHPTLNGELSPDNLTPGTNKKIWWKCSLDCDYIKGVKCENVWRNSGAHRRGGQICPVHNNGGLHSDGRNSLQTLIPKLMEEWNFEKNRDIFPDKITISSGRKAHWICKDCNGKWSSVIAMRTRGHGCASCKKKTQKILFDIVCKILPECNPIFDYNHPNLRFTQTEKQLKSGRKGSLMQLDIWIPELSLGIEYQGFQHYESVPFWGGDEAFEKQQNRDAEKRDACSEHGITLIEIENSWEGDLESIKSELAKHGFQFKS